MGLTNRGGRLSLGGRKVMGDGSDGPLNGR